VALTALGDDAFASRVGGATLVSVVDRQRQRIETAIGDDVDIAIADSRYGFINRVAREAASASMQARRTRSDAIDRIVLHRVLGIPIFLLLMYVMFTLTINVGGAFVDFFDVLGGTLFVKGTRALLLAAGSPAWLTVLLADGVGRGLQIVGTFIPILGALFLALAFLEDCGYMARAAFVMDRFMRAVGLPGKAFVPMLIGFGCNVPAIMATRTLEHPRDRLVTILMNPFMSCGARLPVYALFAAAFFPAGGQTVVFGLYLIGIAMAVLTGLVLRRTLLRGEVSTFVMELPPYLLPTIKGLLLRTWDRLAAFVFRAGRVIVLIVMILSLLEAIGTDGSFGGGNKERSVLSAIARASTPVFAPMGVREDNWPALVGLVTGVFAKETIVGTLNALYAGMARDADESSRSESFSVGDEVGAALATIRRNLGELTGKLLDPLGVGIGDVSDPQAAAAEQGVALGTYGAMVQRFDGRIGAFAYLLFILLYFPCVAATAAVHRETTTGWTAFVAAWTTGWAYVVSVGFYQAATFARHPATSALWLAGLAVACGIALVAMRMMGARSGEMSGGTST
jgi:ferrous iron transport protein B